MTTAVRMFRYDCPSSRQLPRDNTVSVKSRRTLNWSRSPAPLLRLRQLIGWLKGAWSNQSVLPRIDREKEGEASGFVWSTVTLVFLLVEGSGVKT